MLLKNLLSPRQSVAPAHEGIMTDRKVFYAAATWQPTSPFGGSGSSESAWASFVQWFQL